MDFIVENANSNTKIENVTVRQLINKLLDCPMDDVVIVKDSKDDEVHNVRIVARNQTEKLGALFG